MGDEVDGFGRQRKRGSGGHRLVVEDNYNGGRDGGRHNDGDGGRRRRKGPHDRDGNPTRLPPPLMSFKSFVLTQEDAPPELYQIRFEEYQRQYLQDFSNAFFHISKTEEWFQDRFNPTRTLKREEENTEWAGSESELLLQQILEDPAKAIGLLRLGPERAAVDATVPNAEPIVREGDEEDDEILIPTNESMATISGYENRTVAISSIHACCTRSIFTASVNEALNEANAEPPTRILVGQPAWVGVPVRFEKCAFAIFPTVEAAKEGQKILKDTRFGVPGKIDKDKGEPQLLFTFDVKCRLLHEVPTNNKGNNPSPFSCDQNEFRAYEKRVNADVGRGLELAALLDEERSVPEATRLATFFDNEKQPAIVAQLEADSAVPTDKLDIIFAYLNRVHFVNLYTGRRYTDEAHMLACNFTHNFAPLITYRPNAFVPAAETMDDADNETEEKEGEGDGDAIDAADETEGAAKGEDDHEEVPAETQVDPDVDNAQASGTEKETHSAESAEGAAPDGTVDASAAMDEGGKKLKPKREKRLVLFDKKVLSLIEAAKNSNSRMYRAKAKDIADGTALKVTLETTFSDLMTKRCPLEEEGKARCCFPGCAKLFRSMDFLKKHMKSKHELFCIDELTRDAEPYMRDRYDNLDIRARPLPPLEVEAGGRLDQRGVGDIINALGRSRGPNASKASERRRDDRGRGRDDRGDRGSGRGRDNGGKRGRPEMTAIQPKDESGRQMRNYMDVDAPTTSAVSVDYGVVAAPPVKRRKKVVK